MGKLSGKRGRKENDSDDKIVASGAKGEDPEHTMGLREADVVCTVIGLRYTQAELRRAT